jgi:aminoglycoside phosphotransferase (APT) family kinase protein
MTRDAAGRVVARGSDADVYALDDRRVLRRYRRRDVPEAEVAIMRYARDNGYPVPGVLDVSGPDLVLERVDGPTMLEDLGRRPWTVRAHARTLARLHRSLHAIPPPAFLRGEGPRLLHLDLHPANVMLGRQGPVVIDWANASRGDAALDVALTTVVLAGAPVGPPLSWLRGQLVRRFTGEFADDEWRPAIERAIAYRRADGNVGDGERARLAALRL